MSSDTSRFSSAASFGKPQPIRSVGNSIRSQSGQKGSKMCTQGLANSRGCHISSLMAKAAVVPMAIGTLAMLGLALPSAHASMSVYEPFNYAAGSTLKGQAANGLGLTGSWTGGTATIASGSLSEGSLATSGNSLSNGSYGPGGSGDGSVSANLSSPIGATVGAPLWVSFLMRVANNSAWGGVTLTSSTTNLFVGFTGASTGPAFVVQQLGSSSGSATGSSISQNTTYLMVLEDVANSGGAPDTLKLWENPTAGISSPSGAPDITNNGIGPIGKINSIGASDYFPTQFDEIRIGTSYTDVTPVPEPASMGILGAGVLGLLLMGRKRKTA